MGDESKTYRHSFNRTLANKTNELPKNQFGHTVLGESSDSNTENEVSFVLHPEYGVLAESEIALPDVVQRMINGMDDNSPQKQLLLEQLGAIGLDISDDQQEQEIEENIAENNTTDYEGIIQAIMCIDSECSDIMSEDVSIDDYSTVIRIQKPIEQKEVSKNIIANAPVRNNKIPQSSILEQECIKCKVLIPENAKFCPECGAAQKVKHCVECGFKFISSEKFCPECGTHR